MNNRQLAKQIYEDMLRFWSKTKLSYILNMEKVKQLDPTVTTQQVLDEFRKYPLIREVWDTGRYSDTVTIFPR
jgi:hypothetical protein